MLRVFYIPVSRYSLSCYIKSAIRRRSLGEDHGNHSQPKSVAVHFLCMYKRHIGLPMASSIKAVIFILIELFSFRINLISLTCIVCTVRYRLSMLCF